MNKQKINIPFDGFYESVSLDAITRSVEAFIENQNDAEICRSSDRTGGVVAQNTRGRKITEDDLEINYREIFRAYAKEYVSEFRDYLWRELSIRIELEFESLDSPKEYNFDTDRIVCLITEADIARLYNITDKKTLEAVIIERHSSASGFISFYSTDAEDWRETPVKEWDLNMLGTLLIAAIRTADAKSFEQSPAYELLYAGSSPADAFREKVSNIVDSHIKIRGEDND